MVLASGLLTLASITGPSARGAADECLAKPSGPTTQGQHWYYRIDHANNGRQCWYLRTGSARAQKTSRQMDRESSDAMAQAIQAPAPTAKVPPEENAAPVAAPIPWLTMQTLSAPVSSVTPQRPAIPTQSNDAPTATASGDTLPEKNIDPANAVPSAPALSAESNATSAHRAREQQRRQQAQARPEPPPPVVASVDHTFALLMVVFAALAIAGPALHFAERRRRRREAIDFRPPPLARVVALNAPIPRIRVTQRLQGASPVVSPRVVRSPVPVPVRPPDQTERLAHALQQLIDRLQTVGRPAPKTVRARPGSRVSI